ncbi:MAG: glutamine--tRNA ligase/YqeY domain fusion protein [Desulfobulbaceae bacterium]|uniref:Glutamine--tRNA ligase n=1 Tax=Candidatus Desulfobia pelagia TaxID=2841692 RepID=A0A8J6TD91_9BACT|nr:glutamine--tRNA ligase/YqeY domain fusion protein [Candidatus Desulfobia pelagia]
MTTQEHTNPKSKDFIRTIIANDLSSGKHSTVTTRFPPEPNGFLHIGHAKSICLNFGVASENNGTCHLRFDDTNPSKEEEAYVEAIKTDVAWLGFNWGDNLFFASNYFEKLYSYAVELIKMGKAYVCDLSPDEMRTYRGTLTEPGKDSPYRNRSAEENLTLFEQMKAGEFADGSRVLRAKIDMSSGNINMRDPVLYRILRATHHRTGDTWCIYPMYDYTHCLSDAIEAITHSLCTLEFADHRPLYDWVLDTLKTPCHPQQIEFARLNLTYTVMSKRKLLQLVNEEYVSGWDDPRMLTISGLRRRGYTPASIRTFCDTIGLAKRESRVDMAVLENCIRNDLNDNAPRAMAVLKPLKVLITNYPEDQEEELVIANHPKNPEMGSRTVPFCREIYIEQDDFLEDPPKKFFRLAPGREVRLRAAYLVTCDEVIKDENGNIKELHCSYDPASRGGSAPDGRKVKGTLHWVSARHALQAEVRLYDRLFNIENPEIDKDVDFKTHLNPNSLEVLSECMLEPNLSTATSSDHFQFERLGYFCPDSKDSLPGKPVFNHTVTLRDTWDKVLKK